MEISPKAIAIAVGAMVLSMLLVAGGFTLYKRSYDNRIIELQNAVAIRDKTIETQKDVYQKLSIQTDDLSSLLNSKDGEVKRLKDQLNKSGAQLLTANTIIVQLRKDLSAAGTAVVVVQPGENGEAAKFSLSKDEQFGPFGVSCNMSGEEPVSAGKVQSKLSLTQKRPINFSVVVSQDKDGTWRSSATSSEDVLQVDIGLAGVNPYLLEPKWYEKFGMTFDLGVGTGPGFLAGLGLTYQIGKFELGPRAWIVVDRVGVAPYFGAQMLWHPFQR